MHERILFMFRLETSVIDRPAVWSDYRSIWIQKRSHVHLKDTESEVIQSFSHSVVVSLQRPCSTQRHHWSTAGHFILELLVEKHFFRPGLQHYILRSNTVKSFFLLLVYAQLLWHLNVIIVCKGCCKIASSGHSCM